MRNEEPLQSRPQLRHLDRSKKHLLDEAMNLWILESISTYLSVYIC